MSKKRSSSTNFESYPSAKFTRAKSSLDFSNSNDDEELGFCRDDTHRYVEYTPEEYQKVVEKSTAAMGSLLKNKKADDSKKKRGRPKRTSNRFIPKACKKEKIKTGKRVGRPGRHSSRFIPKDEREEKMSNEGLCARESQKTSNDRLKSLRCLSKKPEYNDDRFEKPRKKSCKQYSDTYYRSDTKKGHKIGNCPIPEEEEGGNECNTNGESLKADFLAMPGRLVAMTPEFNSQLYYNVQYLANILVEVGVGETMNELSWVIIKSAQLFYNYEHHFVPATTDVLIIINQSVCHRSQIEDTEPRVENF